MKRTAFFIVAVLCMAIVSHAGPKYIVIQKRLLWGWKLKHVEKPAKRLHKWAFDQTNDTYYRLKSSIGVAVKAKVKHMREHTEYVTVKQGWTSWKISSADKPRKNPDKWYPDPEGGPHYRIRYYWGTAGRIR